MRKIEQEMVAAVRAGRVWAKDNTKVWVTHESDGSFKADVWLHGNHIADYFSSSLVLKVNEYTLSRWPTNTTKSRLRALGANVTTKKGVTYLNGKAV